MFQMRLRYLSRFFLWMFLSVFFFGTASGIQAGYAAPKSAEKLSDRLASLRKEALAIEEQLIQSAKSRNQARQNLRRIQKLIELQKEERKLSQKRLEELEKTILELESRKGKLNARISERKELLKGFLVELERSLREKNTAPKTPEVEEIEAPRMKVLSRLVDRGVREIETLNIDLIDADLLEARIQEEKQTLTYLFQNLKEQEGVLELNKRIQVDLLREKHQTRLGQLKSYRKLKTAEAQVEDLISDFNARLELEKTLERERVATRAMIQGVFARMKGKLPLPLEGKVISRFGRSFDPTSKLHVFKKGIDIEPLGKKNEVSPVRAIAPGKVAFVGELPNYGKLTIIDHGEQYYSLCAQLGELKLKEGELVTAGDVIASTSGKGKPIYFEIRARNIPVNPLQWVSN